MVNSYENKAMLNDAIEIAKKQENTKGNVSFSIQYRV